MKDKISTSHIRQDSQFLLLSSLMLMIVYGLGRLALLFYNADLSNGVAAADIANAFLIGSRFDLVMTSYIIAPLVILMLRPKGLPRTLSIVWLTCCATLATFLNVTELDFYREFHVRLNTLATQYLSEDPHTVISMIWYGYPVVRYMLLVMVVSWLFFVLVKRVSQRNTILPRTNPYGLRLAVVSVLVIVVGISARGTLRQGPPLRWGDAFHSQSLFANHLALNGNFTLLKSMLDTKTKEKSAQWLNAMPEQQAFDQTRGMLLDSDDELTNPAADSLLRTHQPSARAMSRPLNVVLILLESFSAEFVDSFGHDYGITPEFDRLRHQGMLFTNFFSNGTHTHQGMFASMTCFPNVPGHEYLMQQPAGDKDFKGMLNMLSQRNYQSLYVYNGDFSWDNQNGFFTRQGMQRFIGRHDYVNPTFSDPTWGVSDQDMFDRAAQELAAMPQDRPFFAFLQTLSNHTPYALPDPLPIKPVTGFGHLDEHLTAMRYSDWALGQFFNKIKDKDFFNNTLFVIVGDHGFGVDQQLTEIDLLRFHVPLLLIGPKVQSEYGPNNSIVGSQVDIVPTVAGLLGGETEYGCWGRDLLAVHDQGRAIIKPSGSDQTTAIVEGDKVLVRDASQQEHLYEYRLGSHPRVMAQTDKSASTSMSTQLLAYIEAALFSLIH